MASEVFADRSCQTVASLAPRGQPRALNEDVAVSIRQVLQRVWQGTIAAVDGRSLPVRADTLCLHGAQPGALAFARPLRQALAEVGVEVGVEVGAQGAPSGR